MGPRTGRVYFTDVPTALLLRDARNLTDIADGHFRALSEFAADAAAGDLPFLTWVEPGFFSLPGQPETDEHPAADVADGERWIKAVYEGLRGSPLWNESAMLLDFDEHGGFYDHVGPPTAEGDERAAEGFNQLGFSIPGLIVSPLARRGATPSTNLSSFTILQIS